jgi:heat shock protein HtpX
MNTLKTWILMGALTILLVLMGSLFGGRTGAFIFLLISVAMNLIGYFYSDKMAIAMTHSRELPEHEAPELHEMIRRLSARAGIPMPRVYLTPSPQPNAFATGRDPHHSAVAVTEGILQLLDRDELEGVIAHELAHIKNRDVLISTIAAMLAGAITWIADMIQWSFMFAGFGNRDEDNEGIGGAVAGIFMAILGPIAAMIIQLAISRSREFKADATGARIAGSPHGLANALLRLEQASHHIPAYGVSPAASHLFIVNPFKGLSIARLFSTHPPIEERVRRLRQLQF